MYIFDVIDDLSLEIEKYEAEVKKLVSLLGNTEQNPDIYECLDQMSVRGPVDFRLRPIIYRKIDAYKEEILSLKRKRGNLISSFIDTASFSPAEMIEILRHFNIYYKCENVNGKRLFMPEGLVLSNRTISEEELDRMLFEYLYPSDNRPVNDTLLIPMHVRKRLYSFYLKILKEIVVKEHFGQENTLAKIANKIRAFLGMKPLDDTFHTTKMVDEYIPVNEKPLTEKELKAFAEELIGYHLDDVCKREISSRIVPNEHISTLASTMVVSDKGIPVYKKQDDNVVLNGDILNILPEEVLGFVDYYIMEKWENKELTIDEALKNYGGKRM